MSLDQTRRGFIGGVVGAASAISGAPSADDAAYFAAEEPFFKEFATEFTLDHVARDPFPVHVEPSIKIRR